MFSLKNIFLILLIVLMVALVGLAVLIVLGKIRLPEKIKEPESDIIVYSPKPGQAITTPLEVLGEARGTWFFEANFPIKIQDSSGNILGTSYVQAEGDWMTENSVPFSGQISFASKIRDNGFLVLAKDNPSGLPEYDKEIRIPVILEPSGYTKVKAYFNNSKMDPEASCNKVFPVEREILRIEAIGSAALWELLKGPTKEEAELGFFTSINQGVRLQSLVIDKDGVARADFDDSLEMGAGGSCRVSAISAQITETLKQFPTIKAVVISINGRTEDILQP